GRPGRQDAIDRGPAAGPVLERIAAVRARAEDRHVASSLDGPCRRRGHVDERHDTDRVGGPGRQQRAGAVARREVHGLAPDARALELDRRVAEGEPGNRLALPPARAPPPPAPRPAPPAPALTGTSARDATASRARLRRE